LLTSAWLDRQAAALSLEHSLGGYPKSTSGSAHSSYTETLQTGEQELQSGLCVADVQAAYGFAQSEIGRIRRDECKKFTRATANAVLDKLEGSNVFKLSRMERKLRKSNLKRARKVFGGSRPAKRAELGQQNSRGRWERQHAQAVVKREPEDW